MAKSCTTHSSTKTGDRWNSSWYCRCLSDLANCKQILPKVAPSPALVEGDKAGDVPGANILHILYLSMFTLFFRASSERKSSSKYLYHIQCHHKTIDSCFFTCCWSWLFTNSLCPRAWTGCRGTPDPKDCLVTLLWDFSHARLKNHLQPTDACSIQIIHHSSLFMIHQYSSSLYLIHPVLIVVTRFTHSHPNLIVHSNPSS